MIRATPVLVTWDEMDRIKYKFQTLHFQVEPPSQMHFVNQSPPVCRRERALRLLIARHSDIEEVFRTARHIRALRKPKIKVEGLMKSSSFVDCPRTQTTEENLTKPLSNQSIIPSVLSTGNIPLHKSETFEPPCTKDCEIRITIEPELPIEAFERFFDSRDEDSGYFGELKTYEKEEISSRPPAFELKGFDSNEPLCTHEDPVFMMSVAEGSDDSNGKRRDSKASGEPLDLQQGAQRATRSPLREASEEALHSKSKEELVELVRSLRLQLEDAKSSQNLSSRSEKGSQ